MAIRGVGEMAAANPIEFPTGSSPKAVSQSESQEFVTSQSGLTVPDIRAGLRKFQLNLLLSQPAQTSQSSKYVQTQSDALINRGKVTVRVIDEEKMYNALARQASINPEAVAVAVSQPEMRDNRYFWAKGLSMRLTDAQLNQMSKGELGRSFLRTMMDIVYNEAPPQRGDAGSAEWRKIDETLLARVQSAVLNEGKTDWSQTHPFSGADLQDAEIVKQADTIVNLGKVGVKKIDFEKLTNILTREAEAHPYLAQVTLFRAEGDGKAHQYALAALSNLSDSQLANLSRTQPGREFLSTAYNLIQKAPQYAKSYPMSQVVAQQMSRVSKAVQTDDAQRANFRGVSGEQLTAAMKAYELSRERADELLPYLNQAMYEYKIDTPLKQAAFLAQISVESVGLTGNLKEIKGEKRSYAPYFGRGAIQLSLSDSYEKATAYFGKAFLDNLDLVADKENAFQTAGWFWSKYKGHDASLMLSGDASKTLSEFNRISLLVNGGTNNYDDRIRNLKNSLEALNVEGRQVVIQEIDKYLDGKK